MKTLMTALAVIAALTLTGVGTASAVGKTPTAAEIAAKMCPQPDRVGRDGLTCAQFADILAAEAFIHAKRNDWLEVLGRLPDTDNEVKIFLRNKVSLAYDCALDVRESGSVIRNAAQYRRAADATFNRIMAIHPAARFDNNLGDCGW